MSIQNQFGFHERKCIVGLAQLMLWRPFSFALAAVRVEFGGVWSSAACNERQPFEVAPHSNMHWTSPMFAASNWRRSNTDAEMQKKSARNKCKNARPAWMPSGASIFVRPNIAHRIMPIIQYRDGKRRPLIGRNVKWDANGYRVAYNATYNSHTHTRAKHAHTHSTQVSTTHTANMNVATWHTHKTQEHSSYKPMTFHRK